MVDRKSFLCFSLGFKFQKFIFKESATRSAMEFWPLVSPRTGLRFMVVSVMFCVILVHLTSAKSQSLLYRGPRAAKKNASSVGGDFERRLNAMEKR